MKLNGFTRITLLNFMRVKLNHQNTQTFWKVPRGRGEGVRAWSVNIPPEVYLESGALVLTLEAGLPCIHLMKQCLLLQREGVRGVEQGVWGLQVLQRVRSCL